MVEDPYEDFDAIYDRQNLVVENPSQTKNGCLGTAVGLFAFCRPRGQNGPMSLLTSVTGNRGRCFSTVSSMTPTTEAIFNAGVGAPPRAAAAAARSEESSRPGGGLLAFCAPPKSARVSNHSAVGNAPGCFSTIEQDVSECGTPLSVGVLDSCGPPRSSSARGRGPVFFAAENGINSTVSAPTKVKSDRDMEGVMREGTGEGSGQDQDHVQDQMDPVKRYIGDRLGLGCGVS